MEIENWLTLVGILVTAMAGLGAFLGPALGALVQFRINQTEPTSDLHQHENRIGKIGNWVVRVSSSPTFLWLVICWSALWILICSYQLFIELGETTPVTRLTVLTISVNVASIVLNLLNLSIFSILASLNRHTELITKQNEYIRNLYEIDSKMIDVVTNIAEKVGSEPLSEVQPPKTAIDKMITVVKGLINAE